MSIHTSRTSTKEKINNGWQPKTGSEPGKPTDELHFATVLYGEGETYEDKSYLFPVRLPMIPGVYMPQRLAVPNAKIELTSVWRMIMPHTTAAARKYPETVLAQVYSEDMESVTKEASVGLNLSMTIKAGFLGSGADYTIGASVQYSHAVTKAHSEGKSFTHSYEIEPGHSCQIWQRQVMVQASCDIQSALDELMSRSDGGEVFYNEYWAPGVAADQLQAKMRGEDTTIAAPAMLQRNCRHLEEATGDGSLAATKKYMLKLAHMALTNPLFIEYNLDVDEQYCSVYPTSATKAA